MDYRIKAAFITLAILVTFTTLVALIVLFPYVFVWIINVVGVVVVTGMIYYFVAQQLKEEE